MALGCSAKCLLRRARRRNIGPPTCCLIRRTAVYGPVHTVVWEGRSREALPYPDCLRYGAGIAAKLPLPEAPSQDLSWHGSYDREDVHQRPIRKTHISACAA